MKYEYPMLMTFINSIMDVGILLFIPAILIYFINALIFTFNVSVDFGEANQYSNTSKLISRMGVALLSLVLSLYLYYVIIHLGYGNMFAHALYALLKSVVIFLFSPFAFIFTLMDTATHNKDIFIESKTIWLDIKNLIHYKYAITIDDSLQKLSLVLFKVFSLVLFAQKIINVMKFSLSILFVSGSKTPKRLAQIFFICIAGVYIYLNYFEISQLLEITKNIVLLFMSGDLK